MSAKVVTYDELKQHKTKDSFYILISGKVYDCTKFIDEHPGGDEVILAEGGKDATEAFDDVGHSDEARSLLPAMLVGDFEGDIKSASKNTSSGVNKAVEQGSNLMYAFPLAALGAYFAWRFLGTTA